MIRTLVLLTVSSLLFGITFAIGQDTSDPLQPNSVWVNDKKTWILTITERNGESFKALWEQTPAKALREVNGKIKGLSIIWLSKDTRPIRNTNAGGDHFGTLKKDDTGYKIDIKFEHPPKGPSGSFTLWQAISNNVATNDPNTKKGVDSNANNTQNTSQILKETKKDNMKPKTITTNQTNKKDISPDSQKIFLEKLIEIRKTVIMLYDTKKNKLNPIVRKEETQKNEKQNQELKQNFKDALIEGQIKNWQGKITITDTGFRILIGNIMDTFTLSKEEIERRRKDKEDDLKANKPPDKFVAPYIYISIKIDSNLDKGIFESLKKVSDFDSIEFSIKKFPTSLKEDLLKEDLMINWPRATHNSSFDITINSKCLESLIPVSK